MKPAVDFALVRSRRALLALALCLLPSLPVVGTLNPAGATPPADSDPLVDSVAGGKGRINYGTGTIRATGYGAPPAPGASTSIAQARLMAMGAARADALRNLAMTVSSVQVTAETKVKNYVLAKDEVRTSLSALLQSPRIVSETTQPDGTAVVVVELPMYGHDSVASAILPQILPAPAETAETEDRATDNRGNVVYSSPAEEVSKGYPSAGAGSDSSGNFRGPEQPAIRVAPPIPEALPRPLPGGEPGLTSLSDPGPFTSVIIDCRGLNLEAIMSPKLYDTTGREIYGTVRVSRDYAIDTGIVSYPRSMTYAIRSARAGSHPLIVRALRFADKHRFNPVISLEDGDRILAANNRDHFLEQTRVLLLVDPVK